jgi:hypothetical protein
VRASVEGQGFTCELVTYPGGMVRLSLANPSGQLIAASTFEPDDVPVPAEPAQPDRWWPQREPSAA